MRANLWSSALLLVAALAGCHRPTAVRDEPAPAAPPVEGTLAPAAPALSVDEAEASTVD